MALVSSPRVLAACLCWAALGLSGCYATPPPQLSPGDLGACHPGAYANLSELTCGRDADCVLCASEDTRCGELHTRADLWRGNPACPRVRDPACGGVSAHCCEGRCVASAGAPPL